MDETIYLKIIVWLLGCGGCMLSVFLGLIAYVHTSQVKTSDRRFSTIEATIIRIFDELKTKQDKRKR